ncbi:MAG: pyridoxamine 5'-phosphate oxidase family protein [Polyangiaceae bacterium]
MERAELVAFLRRSPFWVQASVRDDGAPQAAVIGVAVGDDLELVFDTETAARKCGNLRRDPRVALVFWDGARTLQIEGRADEPAGEERERVKALYFATFPDGREREARVTWFRVRPIWLRDSDFAHEPPRIAEIDPRTLGAG